MKRINVSYIYRLHERLHPLTLWSGEKDLVEIFSNVLDFRTVLEELFNNGNFYGLKACGPIAGRLYVLLEPYANPTPERLSSKVTGVEITTISRTAHEFEIAMLGEFETLPCYLVTPKGGYSLDVLTNTPESLFPPELLKVIPEVKYDVEQAAKCLAYEVPTAAGFHMHRMNEQVMHIYWDARTNGKERPTLSSVGEYIKAIKAEKCGEETVLFLQEGIQKLHRNPLIHEVKQKIVELTTQQAIDLLPLISSAISSMLPAIKEYRGTKSDSSLMEEATETLQTLNSQNEEEQVGESSTLSSAQSA